MAARLPWYQREGAALVMASLHMPDSDHKWAYSSIIDMLNDRGRPLPDDAGFICGFTGLSKRKWNIVREFLLNDRDAQGDTRLLLTHAGELSNPRFERERAKRQGEHEKAVEYGRAGGRKSAELRGAGQGNLELSSDYPPKNSPKNAPRVKDNSEIIDPAQSETNDLAQPPPQATRARGKISDIRVIQPTDSLDAAGGGERTVDPEPKALLDQTDLKAILDACCTAAGFYPNSPGTVVRELDLVKGWRDAGVDIERVAIPTIRSAIAHTTDPTSSLKRFDRAVRLEQAKHAGSSGTGAYRAPVAPITEWEDEPPVCALIRADILAALGTATYIGMGHSIRLEPLTADDMGDDPRRPIRIEKRGPSRFPENERDAHVLRAARKHGFTHVW
jgi:hypothetical protein